MDNWINIARTTTAPNDGETIWGNSEHPRWRNSPCKTEIDSKPADFDRTLRVVSFNQAEVHHSRVLEILAGEECSASIMTSGDRVEILPVEAFGYGEKPFMIKHLLIPVPDGTTAVLQMQG